MKTSRIAQMKIWMVVLTTFVSIASEAQVKAYIYDGGGLFYTPVVDVDGRSYDRRGFTASYDLAEAMKSNPQAAEFAKAHQSDAIKASCFLWGGVAASLIYGGFAKGHDYSPDISSGLLFAGLLPSLYFFRQSNKHLLDAINSYNGVTPPHQGSSFQFFLLPSNEPKLGFSMDF